MFLSRISQTENQAYRLYSEISVPPSCYPTPCSLPGAYSCSSVHKNPGKIPAPIFPVRQCFREDNPAWHRVALPLSTAASLYNFCSHRSAQGWVHTTEFHAAFLMSLYTQIYHDFFILQHIGVTGRMLFIVWKETPTTTFRIFLNRHWSFFLSPLLKGAVTRYDSDFKKWKTKPKNQEKSPNQ